MANVGFIDAYFQKTRVVDVSAAVVGIGKTNWISIPAEGSNGGRAKEIMSEHRFDVLPIDENGRIRRYFATQQWNNFDEIDEKKISHVDVVPFDTPIREIIRRFALEDRPSFFLAYGREIVGLISVANLNCRQVRIYLYSLVCDLEVSLGHLIGNKVSEQNLIDFVFEKSGDSSKNIKRRFENDRANGLDVPFIEYLFLPTLTEVIKRFGLHDDFGMSKKNVAHILGSLANFRNKVAHPVSSILVGENPAKEIWKQLDRIDGVLFALHS